MVLFPTISIRDLSDAPRQLDIARRAGDYQLLIFISGNAVEYGLRALRLAGVKNKTLKAVVAIGQSTAERLRAQGVNVRAFPAQPGSEALLKLDTLRFLRPPARALIVRGQGGKEMLAHALRQHGIKVDYLEAYRRERPVAPWPPWRDDVDLIMVSSRENLENLMAMVEKDKRSRLLETPILLGSHSMLELHAQLGFSAPPVIAQSPLDDDMLKAFSQWLEASCS